MRQVGDTTPQEALIYTYWLTILHLLKSGVSWDAIMSFSDGEIAMVLGVQAAVDQQRADEEARTMAKSNMPSSAGM